MLGFTVPGSQLRVRVQRLELGFRVSSLGVGLWASDD